MYRNKLYVSDICTLKKYNDHTFKLTYHNLPVRQKGWEVSTGKVERITGVNKEKLTNNLSRAKAKVFEYSMCNRFDYFVTLTINQEKYNRYDLKTYYKDFGYFLKNYNRKYKTKVQYIFIPEQHEDGAWHMHGLIKGIPKEHLTINEHGYLDWFHYRDNFGYVSIDHIHNQDACSKYITKYVCKDLAKSIKDLGAHLFYNSKGLNKSIEIKKGSLSDNSETFDFECEYVKIKWLDNELNALSTIID